VPSEIDLRIQALKDLFDEKFRAVGSAFAERDVHLIHRDADGKSAVAAALQAAEKAVAKSEVATEKQIEALNERINASSLRAELSVDALRKELLPQITGERSRGDLGQGRQMGQSALIVLIFGTLSALGVIVALVARLP
jgi:hypothetical protein